MIDMVLPEGYYAAGSAYLRDLRKLGLHPEALMWAHDKEADRFVLLMVWSGMEKYGMLRLSELLFQAYRTSLLPRQINPFDVHVFNYDHTVSELLRYEPPKASVWQKYFHGIPNNWPAEFEANDHIYLLNKSWVYHRSDTKRSTLKVGAEWRRFQKSVETAAA